MSNKAFKATTKYTVQPRGLYKLINRIFAVDPQRSTGVPMNPQFRNPPPGSNPPEAYDDPTTVPAADLADNPYWKRDVRRRYPRASVVDQATSVGLLSVGSAAQGKVELIGDAGQKQLVAVKEEGEKGLASFFEKERGVAKDVLGPGGMPPMPSGAFLGMSGGVKPYEILEEQSYGPEYPCRTFQ